MAWTVVRHSRISDYEYRLNGKVHTTQPMCTKSHFIATHHEFISHTKYWQKFVAHRMIVAASDDTGQWYAIARNGT
ncbi:MAG TPA: hypothetical protein VF780_10215 [Nitrosospira sp.]